mgnify:CR=1 FL=1
MCGQRREVIWWKDLEIVLTALCGLFLVLSFIPGVPAWMPYLSIAAGGWHAIEEAWESLRERKIDVHLLMVLAAIGAIVVGHPEDAAALLFLFSLSGALESLTLSKTKSAIEALVQLKPESAILVTPTGDQVIPARDLKAGDHVRIQPFQASPADGRLLTEGRFDESTMTGESRIIERSIGDPVLAGTLNQDTLVTFEVTAPPGDTTLDKVVALVQDAQENKASGERISQWFGQRYTIFVLGAFGLSLAGRALLGHETSEAVYASLILLVALSPCALVISTPATTLSALAYSARRGILVRGGEFIESAGQIDAIAMDKTGTLTEGRPELVEICIGSGVRPAAVPVAALTAAARPNPASACGQDCHECSCITCWHSGSPLSPEAARMLRVAAAAESVSTHPIAEAIVRAARRHELQWPSVEDHRTIPGLGIEATVEGQSVQVGQSKFFEELPGGFCEHVREMQDRGLTSVILRTTEGWAALGMRDVAREGATETIRQLQSMGVKNLAILTGDNPNTAQAIATQVGVTEVHAGLLPGDKLQILSDWIGQGRQVMMVGDGVNDAPALAKARIGIAMGGLGSEAALQASDVVLVQDRIERIPEMIALGRKTNRIIRANLFFAAGMILVLTLFSFFWPSLFGGEMPLPLAVLGHEGSTVLVILNGLRLLRGPGRLELS